jgi:hypothetical protein
MGHWVLGDFVDLAAPLADAEVVGAVVVVLAGDPLVPHHPAAQGRKPFSHDPASYLSE